MQTAPRRDLDFLLDDLVRTVTPVRQAVVLSDDGLLLASAAMSRDDGEHLAALASGIQSLAKGVGKRFDGGPPQQTVIDMPHASLLVTAAGSGACLAVLTAEDPDIGLVAYEMAMLVKRAAKHLAARPR